MSKEKDHIFECKKCGHQLYTSPEKVKKLSDIDCPNCGEESYKLWIYIGEGVFEEDFTR